MCSPNSLDIFKLQNFYLGSFWLRSSPALPKYQPVMLLLVAACFTFEFMKTVHRVPRSQGCLDCKAILEKSSTSKLSDLANVFYTMNHSLRNKRSVDFQSVFIIPFSTKDGFHVLSANVQNKRNIFIKMIRPPYSVQWFLPSRGIELKCFFNQVFAVACYAASQHNHIPIPHPE